MFALTIVRAIYGDQYNASAPLVQHAIVALAVIADTAGPVSPCGTCRQVIHELAPGIMVYWRDENGRLMSDTIDTLLPKPFVWPEEQAR